MLKFVEASARNRDGCRLVDEEDMTEGFGRALKGLTNGFAPPVVQSVHGEDGFQARRQLQIQFEPTLMVQQEQVLVDFAAMVNLEMDRKLKAIRDLTEEGGSDMHAKSVLILFLEAISSRELCVALRTFTE